MSENIKLNNDETMSKINQLIKEYDFPTVVLEDVYKRLNDCQDEHYVAQQLRYLENYIKYMNL